MGKKVIYKEGEPVVEITGQYFGIDLHKDQITWHCISRCADGRLIRTSGIISTTKILEEFVPYL